MKILFINIDNKYGFSQQIGKVLGNMGHDVIIAGCLYTIVEYLNSKDNPVNRGVAYFSSMGNPFSLYEFLKFHDIDDNDLDLIFVEQAMFYFKKGVKDETLSWDGSEVQTPVIFYHRDLWSEAFMKHPDVDLLLYRFWNHRTSLQYVDRITWWMTKYKLLFKNAVNPALFNPDRDKEYKGLNFIGTQYPLAKYLTKDFVQHDYYKDTHDIVEYCREHEIATIHDYHEMKFPIYRAILEKCEAMLFVPGKRAYRSRRLFEAAACKTMLIIYCPDSFSKQVYQKDGLTHGVNCVMFDDITKLKNVYILYKNKRKKIIEKAYEWVLNQHSFEVRAIELEKVFYKLLENIEKNKITSGTGINEEKLFGKKDEKELEEIEVIVK